MEIADLETLVVSIITGIKGKLGIERHNYRVADPTSNDMLEWSSPVEIQVLPTSPFMRVGTVGDGNCMLHSILFAASPTYRTHTKAARSKIADVFRNTLVARIEDLRDIADIFYAEAGGAGAIDESFEILKERREEVNLELGPVMGRLYGINFLAIQLKEDMTMKPVHVTKRNFDATLPTAVINYIGGGLDFGNVNFQQNGHYEAIIAGFFSVTEPISSSSASAHSSGSAGRRGTRKRSSNRPALAADAGAGGPASSVKRSTAKSGKGPGKGKASGKASGKAGPKGKPLNEVASKYLFQPGDPDLAKILALFD
jgi:hypothetical protein